MVVAAGMEKTRKGVGVRVGGFPFFFIKGSPCVNPTRGHTLDAKWLGDNAHQSQKLINTNCSACGTGGGFKHL